MVRVAMSAPYVEKKKNTAAGFADCWEMLTFALEMGKRFNIMLDLLGHYKYLITIVVGLLLVGVIDDNSMLRRWQYSLEISRLEEEIANYNTQEQAATEQLQELRRNPKAIERIARERYGMKAADEDIFVLTDEEISPRESDSE